MAEASTSQQEYDLKDIEMEIKPVQIRDLKPGDHIAVRGSMFLTKYYHHGIYIGQEEGVLDFGTTKVKLPSKIQNVDISQFMGGRQLCRVHYRTGCFKPEATINMAKELFKDPELWGEYNIKTNNCEHFAIKCKTGKHASDGVVRAMRKGIKRIKLDIAATMSTSGWPKIPSPFR